MWTIGQGMTFLVLSNDFSYLKASRYQISFFCEGLAQESPIYRIFKVRYFRVRKCYLLTTVRAHPIPKNLSNASSIFFSLNEDIVDDEF